MPPAHPPTTTAALLDGLYDPQNRSVWDEFDARYRPVIVACARRLGLTEDQAADAAQEALADFVAAYRDGKFDRTRGRLRSWIIGMVKRRAVDILRDASRRREDHGESRLVSLPDDAALADMWEAERRAELLRRALVELRENTRTSDKTLRAFEMFVLQTRSVADVAATLEMSAQEVYVAKNRVADRLRLFVSRLDELYDGI